MSWPDYPSGFDTNTALTCANFVQQAYFQLFANADGDTSQPFPPPFGFPAYSEVLQMPPLVPSGTTGNYTLRYTIQSTESAPYDYFGYVITGPSLINKGKTMTAFVIRGTESHTEWMDDIMLSGQVDFLGNSSLGLVHEGFNLIYGGLNYVNPATGHEMAINEVLTHTHRTAKATDLVITGHSLGGALATLMAMDITANQSAFRFFKNRLTCYTFGSPRVGSPASFVQTFNNYITSGNIVNYRVANGLDIVPGLPPNVYYDTFSSNSEYNYEAVNGFCPIDSGLVDFDFHSLNAYAAGLQNLITPPTGLAIPRRAARRRPPRTQQLPLVAVPPRPSPEPMGA